MKIEEFLQQLQFKFEFLCEIDCQEASTMTALEGFLNQPNPNDLPLLMDVVNVWNSNTIYGDPMFLALADVHSLVKDALNTFQADITEPTPTQPPQEFHRPMTPTPLIDQHTMTPGFKTVEFWNHPPESAFNPFLQREIENHPPSSSKQEFSFPDARENDWRSGRSRECEPFDDRGVDRRDASPVRFIHGSK